MHEKCTKNVTCSNCSGNHPSSSSICPAYLERHENLTKQHSVCLYILITYVKQYKNTILNAVLLQEVWHPEEDTFNIWQYTKPVVKLRKGSEGGGVAILTHNKV